MIHINQDRCIGCGDCVQACQFGAITLHDGKAVIDQTQCRGCAICMRACLQDAIAEVAEPSETAAQIVDITPTQGASSLLTTHRAPQRRPWFGPAVLFVGREIVPRLATALLDAWDRRSQQAIAPSAQTYTSPLLQSRKTSHSRGGRRGRQRRLRHRAHPSRRRMRRNNTRNKT